VLTYQGHFEFDSFVNAETVKVFGPLAGWDRAEVKKVAATCEGESDWKWAAGVVMRFFVEDAEDAKTRAQSGIVIEGCATEVEKLEGEEGVLHAMMQSA
jgi:hypothetical protein